MKIGMTIGCDGKLNFILDTIRVCESYVNEFIICDTGSWNLDNSIHEKIINSSNKIKYFRLPIDSNDLNFLPLSHKLIYSKLNENDWFLYLDSDERPNLYTLQDWNFITSYLESKNSSIGLITGLLHKEDYRNFNDETIFNISDELFFKKSIVVKKCEDNKVYSSTNHSGFANYKNEFFISKINKGRPYYYTHVKTDFSQINGAIFWSHNNLESLGINKDNEIYVRILSLNEKYGLLTSNHVVKYIIDNNDFPDEILNYYDELTSSHNNEISFYFSGWSKYIRRMKSGINMTFNNLKENFIYYSNSYDKCKMTCCKYDLIQL